MWKYVGGDAYLPGMPRADMTEEEWKRQPSERRERARHLKLYEHHPEDKDEPEDKKAKATKKTE